MEDKTLRPNSLGESQPNGLPTSRTSFKLKSIGGSDYSYSLMLKSLDYLKNGGKLEVKNRFYRFKLYPNCFLGTEAVSVLLKSSLPISTIEDAVALGRHMVENRHIEHVCRAHTFKNERLFYQFCKEDDGLHSGNSITVTNSAKMSVRKYREQATGTVGSTNTLTSLEEGPTTPTTIEFDGEHNEISDDEDGDRRSNNSNLLEPLEHVTILTKRASMVSSRSESSDTKMLTDICQRMQEYLDIKDRRYLFRTFRNCFVGTDAIDWLLLQGYAVERQDAVLLGQRFLDAGIIEHVTQRHPFADQSLFYRFKETLLAPMESIDTNLRTLTQCLACDFKLRKSKLASNPDTFEISEVKTWLFNGGYADTEEEADHILESMYQAGYFQFSKGANLSYVDNRNSTAVFCHHRFKAVANEEENDVVSRASTIEDSLSSNGMLDFSSDLDAVFEAIESKVSPEEAERIVTKYIQTRRRKRTAGIIKTKRSSEIKNVDFSLATGKMRVDRTNGLLIQYRMLSSIRGVTDDETPLDVTACKDLPEVLTPTKVIIAKRNSAFSLSINVECQALLFIDETTKEIDMLLLRDINQLRPGTLSKTMDKNFSDVTLAIVFNQYKSFLLVSFSNPAEHDTWARWISNKIRIINRPQPITNYVSHVERDTLYSLLRSQAILLNRTTPDFSGYQAVGILTQITHNLKSELDVEILHSFAKSGEVTIINLMYAYYETIVTDNVLAIIENVLKRDVVLSKQFFFNYLLFVQGETEDTAENLSGVYARTIDKDNKEALTPTEFLVYLYSDDNTIMRPECKTIHQEMTFPITHYFINSSHNTYLFFDQLSGESTIEAYIRALLEGCRCIELDTWDGESEAIITHGRTLCSTVPAIDVLRTIRLYAFEASDYPVILSFENHCSPDQEKKLAEDCSRIFGDFLYREPFDKKMPSPEDLKFKIIIKAKKKNDDKGVATESDTEIEVESPNLSALATICKSIAFKGLSPGLNNQRLNEMSSFVEGKATKILSDRRQWMHHNILYFSRIYPNGKRVDSSNYDPQQFWNAGVQLVALNFQTSDRPLQLNNAQFKEFNGGCGYVLKPDYLLGKISRKDCMPIILSVEVLASHLTSLKAYDEYSRVSVTVRVDGFQYDTQFYETPFEKITKNRSSTFNMKQTFEILTPPSAKLSFIVNVTKKKKALPHANYGLPVLAARQGCRKVPLWSRDHKRLDLDFLVCSIEYLDPTEEVLFRRSSKNF